MTTGRAFLSKTRPLVGALVAVLLAVSVAPGQAADRARGKAPGPAFIAVLGENGLNPASAEFRLTGPLPALPPHEVVRLPRAAASFDAVLQAMQAGPLGRLTPGRLYRVAGTRLLIYPPDGLAAPYDVVADRGHGTGVVGSAIGRKYGTFPSGWVVFVPTDDPSGYEWLADQDWIDVASVSSYGFSVGTEESFQEGFCRSVTGVRRFAEDRLLFASAGNEEQSSYYLLNAVPEMYLVGGVDKDGDAVMRPAPPPSNDLGDVKRAAAPLATRTFETGDRYQFSAADPDSVEGTTGFGATSGATPSTAGRAAAIIASARRILGDTGARPASVLAAARAGAVLPRTGPLADGRLTSAELSTVLHALAVPKLSAPGRYLVEGYGSLLGVTPQSIDALLRGVTKPVVRDADDQDHRRSEDARRTAFTARGCT